MSTSKVIPKLHAVTLVRSGIGRPWWQKKTLEALKLTKMHKTVIHKNTPSMNGHLASVKELIKVQPVVIRTDRQKSPNGGEFLQDNGHFFMVEDEGVIDGEEQ
jgi:large subunit ribosomal protein L30